MLRKNTHPDIKKLVINNNKPLIVCDADEVVGCDIETACGGTFDPLATDTDSSFEDYIMKNPDHLLTNWKIIKNLTIDKPWFLSGGINSNNIEFIIKEINPFGVDLSSGLEKKLGIKDNHIINNFMSKFKNA